MKYLLILVLVINSLCCLSQNKNISNGFTFDGEPYLAINPNNSQHLIVAWMGYKLNNNIVIKTRVSFDAGQTWSNTNNIPHIVSGYQSADPSLAFDNNGNLFLCYIDYTSNPISGAVYVVKSIDGGLTWNSPVEVLNANSDGTQYPIDRPWMVIDNSGGQNDGNIYITTTNPNVFGPVSPPYNPYFIKSTNNGVSFEPWRYLDTTNWLAGNVIPQPMATPAISSNGTFHAIYPSYLQSQSLFARYIIASSNNIGNTFDYHTVFLTATVNSDTLPKKGYLLKANPADSNHLIFSYPNFDNGDIDVYIKESLNAGVSWSSPIRVNDDPISNDRMQDLIWADFDDDGDFVVTWRDRRNSNDSTYKTSSEIYGAVLWKDSTNFSTNFVLTDSSVSYHNILAESGNDFMCVDMINDTIYAVWGDTRNNFLNIWFQQIDLINGTTAIKDLANDLLPIQLSPNPANQFLNYNLGDNSVTNSHYEIINIKGQTIVNRSIENKKGSINIESLKSGIYLVKFTTAKGSIVQKFIKQ